MLYPPINLIAEWLWHDVHSPWSHDRLFLIATGVWSSLKLLEFKDIIEMLQHTFLILLILSYVHSFLPHDLEYHSVTNLGN